MESLGVRHLIRPQTEPWDHLGIEVLNISPGAFPTLPILATDPKLSIARCMVNFQDFRLERMLWFHTDHNLALSRSLAMCSWLHRPLLAASLAPLHSARFDIATVLDSEPDTTI